MTLSTENSSLSDDQKDEFCSIMRFGCDRITASKFLGCTLRQIQRALHQDPQFAKQLARAEATPELMHMRNLQNAAKDEKHWRVSVWWLEHCAAERYARRNPDAISAAQLRQIIKQLSDAIAGEVANQDDRTRLMKRLANIASGVESDEQIFPLDSDQEFALL